MEDDYIDSDSLLQYINATDVKNFGLIPELMGRFPVISYLEPLDPFALKRILTEPKNALIKQYEKIFKLDGIKLSIEQKVFDFIVSKAIEYQLGARGLRSICEAILTDAMFDYPSSKKKKLNITLEYARGKFKKSKIAKLKVA